ncbi:IPTL-CTERM sorting domain-containing protein [Ottowia caeni]|uniref:IPTL-CTERM sorting domain-containing protein n=1 Tax=Ottowia caeni TaxID=2870339 RepID=UPI003D70FAC2
MASRKVHRVYLAGIVGFAMMLPSLSSALTVTNLSDSGAGSLRDAVANTPAGGVVDFDPSVTGAISLASQIVIDKALNITGPGASTLAVVNGAGRIFRIDAGGGGVNISGLRLSGSGSPVTDNGGAILNVSNALTLDAVTINASSVVGDWRGGGIGGAIHSFWSAAGTSLTIRNSTISGNSATKAGAIYVYNQALVVENSTIAGNTASDSAGAISLDTTWAGTIFRHSTIVGNTANIGSGVYARGNSLAEFVNSIVSGNNDQGNPALVNDLDRADGTVSATGSLFSEANSTPDVNGTNVNNLFATDPMLGALANNGGTTMTMLPQTGSPAIDAVACIGLTPDQRLVARPLGALCDIGAVEVRVAPPPPPPVTAIPTLSQWGLMLLGLLAAGLGARRMRKV